MKTITKTALRTSALALASVALAACSSVSAPSGEIAVAQSAVQRVSTAPQVTARAPVELQQARDLLAKADKAMSDKEYVDARRYAEAAEAQARVAETKALAEGAAIRLNEVQRGLRDAQGVQPR